MRSRLFVLFMLLLLNISRSSMAQDIPLFDAHIHYNQNDWEILTPEQVLAILDRAGVQWALVSSTPDEGTLRLYEIAPHRVVPFLRPYRSWEDRESWPYDQTIQTYVEERLPSGIYRGIGEFHLALAHVEAPVVKRFAELAVQYQLFWHAHVDATTVEKLLHLYPNVCILWAHAGMSAAPDAVGQLLDRFPRLWAELSIRSDIAPNGILDPAWRAIFLQHPDRFLIGTDTWSSWRWKGLIEGAQRVRGWLSQLPATTATQLAYQNAERLFGPSRPRETSLCGLVSAQALPAQR